MATTRFHASKSRYGFAWNRLLLGLLVFGGMIALGIPLRGRSERANNRDGVSEDLMRIVAAREHYALEHNLNHGTTVTLEQLFADGKYIKERPASLLEREVRLGPVGGRVAALVDGEWFDPLPTAATTTSGSTAATP